MKKLLFVLALLIITSNVFAQRGKKAPSDDYERNMEIALKVMDSAKKISQMQQAADAFTHFVNTKQDKWLPPYYAAYCYAQMSFMGKNNKEKAELIEKAQFFVDQAKERVEEDNAEVWALQAYLYQISNDFSPEMREKNDQLFNEAIAEAENIDADNPRIYSLKAEKLFLSPNGDQQNKMDEACPVATEAIEKFDAFEVESKLSPTWGKEFVQFVNAMCNPQKEGEK